MHDNGSGVHNIGNQNGGGCITSVKWGTNDMGGRVMHRTGTKDGRVVHHRKAGVCICVLTPWEIDA